MLAKDGLVVYWSLEETSGIRVDSKGSNNLTDNNTVTSAAGVIGTGAFFTAANLEYLSIADNTDVSTGDIDFSFQVWFKLASDISCNILTKDTDTPANSRDYGLDYISGLNEITFYILGGSDQVSWPDITTGVWYHVCCGHSARFNEVWISVNGGTPLTYPTGGHIPDDSGAEFRIGASAYAGFEDYFDGTIDEVGMWKRDIRGNIPWLYNGGYGQSYAEIVASTYQPVTHVQTQFNEDYPVTNISVTIVLTPGNAVIVSFMYNGGSKPGLTGLAQTSGDVLTFAGENDGAVYTAQYVAYNVVGGVTTFKFDWSGGYATYVGLYATEVFGLLSAGIDQTASGAYTTDTLHTSGTTPALSQASEFALATFNADGSGAPAFVSLTNGFIVPTNGNQFAGANTRNLLAYAILNSTDPIGTILTTNTMDAEGLIVTYKTVSGDSLNVMLGEPTLGASVF